MKQKMDCLSTQEIEKRLEMAGINPTAQRIAICRYVLCEADHPTAEQIKEWIDKNFPKMSLATVYNTLKVLVDAGLLRELRFPHSECALYDANTNRHFHFLDEKTGELIDIEPEQVDLALKLNKKNFQVSDVEVLIRGTRS